MLLSQRPKLFESGVVKVQTGNADKLNRSENKSIACLLEGENEHYKEKPEPVHSRINLPMIERLKKARKNSDSSIYIALAFILGSVAEVERLWRVARYILSDHRQSLTPQIFLKMNERFLDSMLICEALMPIILARCNQMRMIFDD